MAAFQKGQPRPPNAGRKPGSVNKTTGAFKEALLALFHDLGAEKFKQWALDNPDEFYKLCGRLIPTEITGSDGGSIEIRHTLIQSVLDEQK